MRWNLMENLYWGFRGINKLQYRHNAATVEDDNHVTVYTLCIHEKYNIKLHIPLWEGIKYSKRLGSQHYSVVDTPSDI